MLQSSFQLNDFANIQGIVRINLGAPRSDKKPAHFIDIDGLRCVYSNLGKDKFKKFIDNHEIYTNREGIRFVRGKFGKRNAVKTYIKLIVKLIKTA